MSWKEKQMDTGFSPDKAINLHELIDQSDELIFQFRYSPKTTKYSFPFANKKLVTFFNVSPHEVRNDAKPSLEK
ncbi:MAG: hypothetical protein V7767_11610, partial [Leeuwenhoekiella sp.]